jgi:hypothetical protein
LYFVDGDCLKSFSSAQPPGLCAFLHLTVPPIIFGIRDLAFQNQTRRAADLVGIWHGHGRGQFGGNGPHALQGKQEIRRSGRIVRSAEDFVLIFF